ncbi:MAG: hypothetical protein KIT09_25760 [Bryobacteraceae bacterium]|nr:hypothetical protein [Bryobacteraceae bacterium]
MHARGVLCLFAAAAALNAQTLFFPLTDVRPGLRGVGKTVFSGATIDEFGVEILGVLKNVGPRQSVVLARLSGGSLENSGVLQGMSGSPVYIDGKLLGAVALAFQFSKEPIAGIRPIEDMISAARSNFRTAPRAQARLDDRRLTHLFPQPVSVQSGGGRLVEIATPVAFSGFTPGTLDEFMPELRAIGLEPAQGISGGGGAPSGELARASDLRPGAMISVQLLSGDMSVGADGTVTHIEGENVYAFGHRFLSVGETELPFARSEVVALAPNLSMSFKISAPQEWAGVVTGDYSAAVTGQLGRRAAMVPVSISVTGHNREGKPERPMNYKLAMVNDRYLAPFLLQMALYSAIDATERTLGTGALTLRGQIKFQGADPIRLDDMYAGEGNMPLQVSLAAAIPVAYLLQSGFENLKLENVSLAVEAFNEKKLWHIDQAWPSRKIVRPAESVDLAIVLLGPSGAEMTRTATYRVPVGARPGPLLFTVSDGTVANMNEYQRFIGKRLPSANQVVAFLNKLRSNTNAYVRAWRYDTSYIVQGRNLPQPPPSVSLILGGGQPALSGAEMAYTSDIAEMVVDVGNAVVSGSKTIQVEIEE